MKKVIVLGVILLSLVIVVKVYAWCQTDYTCVNDCVRQGYMWGYCRSICSWCQ